MPGPNTTGLANPNDYNLGRGILYFAELISGRPVSWRDMGNCPSFTVNNASETLEHQSSRQGLKQTDKEVVLSRSTTLSFSLDEFNDQNLSDLFSATTAKHTNVAVAGFTNSALPIMVPDGRLALGRWYDIVNQVGERAYDIDKTKLVVKTNMGTLTSGIGGTQVTLAEGVDYDVDETMGRIFIRATSTPGATAVSGGRGLAVTLTADATAKDVNEIKTLTRSSVIGALKFISENPASDGFKYEYQFHQVTLKADGDLALIGDDWSTMQFTAKAEANPVLDPDSPTCTIRSVALT